MLMVRERPPCGEEDTWVSPTSNNCIRYNIEAFQKQNKSDLEGSTEWLTELGFVDALLLM